MNVADRPAQAGTSFEQADAGLLVIDPWGNEVRFLNQTA